MPLRVILFDKDGTFVHFQQTWNEATAAVIEELAGGSSQIAARLSEVVHFDQARRELLPTSPFIGGSIGDLGPAWAAILGVDPDRAFLERIGDLFHDAALDASTPIGEPAVVFAELKAAGYRLGVITNDSEAGARAQCEKLGLSALFDTIIGYDSGFGRKPEAGQIIAAMARLDVGAAETALVGDTLHDLEAAKAARVTAIGVESGFLGAAELLPYADHVIADIMALPALLRGIAADQP